MTTPRLAITLGDPRGIGAEIVRKALADPRVAGACRWVVVGPSGLECAADEVIGEWHPRQSAANAGRLAGKAIERAVAMARSGDVAGIVTAPIDKHALLAGGYDYPGHTEMLAALTGCDVAMMLASDRLRVVLATTHYTDAAKIAEVSEGLGDAMPGLDIRQIDPAELMQTRGW